jgi:hypothetical protein
VLAAAAVSVVGILRYGVECVDLVPELAGLVTKRGGNGT